jgi:uncharacterized protein (TIGR00369 family)
MADLACSEQELAWFLSGLSFTRSYGFTLHGAAEGRCSLDVPFREDFERPGGIVNGLVFIAAADVAMWLAIKTRLGLADPSVTAEMKTSFLRSARKEGFRCTATVLKLGRRLIYGVAECVDGGGSLLAHHTLTYIRAD